MIINLSHYLGLIVASSSQKIDATISSHRIFVLIADHRNKHKQNYGSIAPQTIAPLRPARLTTLPPGKFRMIPITGRPIADLL